MSGGGSASRSKSKSQSAPWIGQQPFLTDVFSQAQGLYNQGVPSYYPGATYTPFNRVQQDAMGATLDRAGGSQQEGNLGSWINQALMQPQFNLGGAGVGANQAIGGIPAAMSGLYGAGGPSLPGGQNYAQSGGNPFLAGGGASDAYVKQLLSEDPTLAGRIGDIQGSYDSSIDPTARTTLEGSARGDMFGSNPFLDDTFDRASSNVRDQFNETVMPGINATFGSAGRTGSGLHQASVGQAGEDLADTLGNLATDIYGGDYTRERDRQLASAKDLASLGLTSSGQDLTGAGLGAEVYGGDAARQLGAAGLGQEGAIAGENIRLGENQMGADLYNQGENRELDALSQLFSGGLSGIDALASLYGNVNQAQQGAAGMVPGLSDLQYSNIDRAMGVGDRTQDLSREILGDDINRFQHYSQGPQDLLSNYAAIIQALGLNQSRNKGSSWSTSGYGGIK